VDASEQPAGHLDPPTITTPGDGRPVGLGVAAVASIAAGLIHAGAIGVHAEHVGLARMFMAAAVFQIGWGAVALVHPRRWIGLVGAVGSLAVVAAWLVTRVADISWISGLEVHEPPAFADSVCAAFGAIAAGGGLVAWLVGDRAIRVPRLALTALAAAALAVPALASASSHTHAEGEAHSHGEAAAPTALAAGESADGHTHADAATPTTPADGGTTDATAGALDASATDATGATGATAADGHTHAPAAADATGAGASTDPAATGDAAAHEAVAAVAPVPYDPSKPIDLGGVPGVTPEQQARAENLVAITVLRLPQWADVATAEAAGFRSIGDGLTGHEHYVNWSYLNDDKILDPDYPESLVYAVDRSAGTKTLVSAMFMLPDGYTLDTAPDIGGALTQWHIHDNLCFAPDPADAAKLRVVGLTGPDGTCTFGTKSENPNPMIHVWITPHPCGPFAALEGVAAGQVKPGETHACDSAHGAH
jgi:hypothetical protein